MHKLFSIAVLLLISTQLKAQEWVTPVIEGYGKIKYFKTAAVQPDSTLTYKLVFDIKDGKEMEGVNVGLFKIARTLNMLGVAGIASKNINIVAAIHGEATFLVLNEEKYQKKYGKSNPNLQLLEVLKQHGVELYVCSQATSARDIQEIDMNEYVQSALSAISVLANYQLRGYALMP
ncbi:DsrE family protein [Flavobacteriaceae bacterium KMM 6897]|nr:DsrE family protein [Flavobacteriaceae bacterium KMM 6897]